MRLVFRLVSTPCKIFIRNVVTRPRLFTADPTVPILQHKMAQRSITSFFTKTPKKSLDKSNDGSTEKSDLNSVKHERTESESEPICSPTEHSSTSDANKPKQSKKRMRIQSSDSEASSHASRSPSPVDTIKKKTPKRQRIESSDSEPASPKKVAEKTPPKPKTKASSKEVPEKAPPEPKAKASPKEVPEKAPPEPKAQASPKEVLEKSPPKPKIKASPKEKTPKAKKSEKLDKSPLVEKDTNVNVASVNIVKTENNETENGKEIMEKVTESTYNPGKSKYHPIEDACWSRGERVPYLALARTLEAIEATSARLRIVETLANYLRSVLLLTPEDLLPSVYLCLNRLAPAYESLELGVAETYLMKAIAQSTGRTLAQVKTDVGKVGDLGLVAEQSRSTQRVMFRPAPLVLRNVFLALKELANMTGQSSMSKKVAKIQSLFVACRESEARYLIRSMAGKLRIGLAEQSVLQALALATLLTPPGQPWPPEVLDASRGVAADVFKARLEAQALIIKTTYCECPNYELLIPVLLERGVEELPSHCRLTPGVPLKPMLAHPTKGARLEAQALIIKTTYCECPNYELLIPVLLERGVEELPSHCRLTPGVPLKPMLAHPTKGVHEVFQRFENLQFTCEWKYDGERAQIHVPEREGARDLARAAVFSRNQEDNSGKYPDVLARLGGALRDTVASCVLDCEAVAWDRENKRILPFQVLSTRKRKDAQVSEIKVQVCLFMFDLLYLNGRALVREPLAERRRLLHEHFNVVEGEWMMATSRDCSTLEEVQEFLEESVRGSCEGLMVKTLAGRDATYEIAKRSRNWLKLKKDYLDGVGDTLDVVVIGAYRGRGKRAGVYGGFLLACYDADGEEFQSLCKIGTGFTDDDLQRHSESLEQYRIDAPRNYYRYDTSHEPDVWLAPGAVWEVRCADLSLSPAHRAAIGLVDPDKGISLRFPRFVRVREDKTPEQATSARQVAAIYLDQDQVKNQAAAPRLDDDFY